MLEKYQFITLLATLLAGFFSIFVFFFKKLDRLEDKIDKTNEKINALDSRVSRIEGILQWLERYFFDSKEN